MGLDLSGFEELEDTLVSLGLVGKREGKKALKEAGKVVLHQQKIDAPRDGRKKESIFSDNVHGADYLSTTEIRVFKTGTQTLGVGITGDNWEFTKGLWFQNFGYENHGLNFSGQYIGNNVGWIRQSFEKCSKKAENVLVNEMMKSIESYL